MEAQDFRFGNVAEIYYELVGGKVPKQLDLLDTWFPGLVIEEIPSDGNTKTAAEYIDREYRIRAVRYHGSLYSGGSTRISQILGRLTGTAAGNREKERKTAELIQKHVAECFIRDMELTPRLKDNVAAILGEMPVEMQKKMHGLLVSLLCGLAQSRDEEDDYDRKTEPFAMDDEVFDGTLYSAAYQLSLYSFSGLCCAWLWFLTGSLLRNETGRVLRLYDSAFIAVRRQTSETGELRDKIRNLFYPQEYVYTYAGDDLEKRFPGVEWYCDGCGAHLNEQEGFDDHLEEWRCTRCGYVNRISLDAVYENDEDYANGIREVDPDRFADAVERRRKELEEEKHEKPGGTP